MNIAFYGSSLLSSYWNGAATYYRGILRALAERGHCITFYEPDAFDRQAHRDIDPPEWACVVVWPATPEGLAAVLAEARDADVVVKANGVGVYDRELLEGVLRHAGPDALKIFWDVDAAATLDEMRGDADHPVRRALPQLDMVFTYGGDPPVVEAYEGFGAREFGSCDAGVARVFSEPAFVVFLQKSRKNVVAAPPDQNLLVAVLRGGFGFVQPLQRAVMPLVQKPGFRFGNPHQIHLVQNDPERANRPF